MSECNTPQRPCFVPGHCWDVEKYSPIITEDEDLHVFPSMNCVIPPCNPLHKALSLTKTKILRRTF